MSSSMLEDLQRKARLLENEIDVRLISLNKFNTSGAEFHHQAKAHNRRSIFESLTGEIETKLNKLNEISDAMQECFEADAGHSKTSAQHIVRRHRDILRDYSTEFNRTCANINNQLHREELMAVEDSMVNNRCKPTDYLLQESESISSCDRLLNEQIRLGKMELNSNSQKVKSNTCSIAMSVKENLYTQGGGLGTIGKRLHQLTKKYPAINNLMNKIRMKKRKDTIILAAVISSCLIFFFIYVMH